MSASHLLIDLGNTRLKWAWLTHDAARRPALSAIGVAAHAQVGWLRSLREQWVGAEPTSIWLSCVAATSIEEALLGALRATFPTVQPHRLQTPARAGGVINAYAEPERLGIDRFLAMVGARSRHAQDLMIVSAGTALTIDVLAANGEHQGGLILPGADLMQEALLMRSGRIEQRHAGNIDWLGRSTEDALASAAWLAAGGLVERTFEEAARRFSAPPLLLLHGGQAVPLAQRLRVASDLEEDLVLRGLARLSAPVAD